MNKTSIEWTTYTSNPIKFRDASGKVVWGCVHASPGCTNCYSEALAHRYGKGGPFTAPVMKGLTPFVDEAELRAILRSKAPAGSNTFLGDMTDIFGPWVTDAMLDQVFATMALRPDLTFQLLTKRPERMREYMKDDDDRETAIDACLSEIVGKRSEASRDLRWPLPNVWLGTSVENQHWADVRIPELLATPAAVRFISAEPLLGPLDLRGAFDGECSGCGILSSNPGFHRTAFRWFMEGPRAAQDGHVLPGPDLCGPVTWQRGDLDWVIVGGESGSGARPCDLAWIRSIVQQCQAAAVPVFCKQVGSKPTTRGELAKFDWPNGTVHSGDVARLKSRKGSDMAEWPSDLRVRSFPNV